MILRKIVLRVRGEIWKSRWSAGQGGQQDLHSKEYPRIPLLVLCEGSTSPKLKRIFWIIIFCRLRLHIHVVVLLQPESQQWCSCERERDHDVQAGRRPRLDAEGRLRRQKGRGRLRPGEVEASPKRLSTNLTVFLGRLQNSSYETMTSYPTWALFNMLTSLYYPLSIRDSFYEWIYTPVSQLSSKSSWRAWATRLNFNI